MWQCEQKNLSESVSHYTVSRYDGLVSYGEILERWVTDEEFRNWFIGLLMESPFCAYRWETPAITTRNIHRGFEFVLLDSGGLERPPDRAAFANQCGDSSIATFGNLSGDATLVVPCPADEHCSYAHLAAFIRTAPDGQIHRLWQAVGTAMLLRVGDQPVWLNTAGMGLAWLHVRLDSRPKYYGYATYRMNE
jgi:hypothetical protein